MPEYLLPLSVLHAAAPGILNVVFGQDGIRDDAPLWRAPIWGTVAGSDPAFYTMSSLHIDSEGPKVCAANIDRAFSPMMRDGALDPTIPSIACRLAGLCLRAAGDLPRRADLDLCWEIIAEAMDNRIHPETAARMVALTLRLAPEIAALGGQS